MCKLVHAVSRQALRQITKVYLSNSFLEGFFTLQFAKQILLGLVSLNDKLFPIANAILF